MGMMTKAVWAGLGTMLIFAVMAASVVGHKQRPKKDMTVAQVLDKLASAANAMKGREVGPNVIVNRASVENGQRLTYFYTIPTIVDGQYNRALAEKLIEEVKRQACADPFQRRAIDGGAEIRYAYRQSNGATIFTIDIDQWACAGVSRG